MPSRSGWRTARRSSRTGLRVTVRRYPDALEATQVEPLLAYARSMAGLTVAHPDGLVRLQAAARAAIRTRGAFHVTKDVGLVIAQVAT